VTAQDRQGPEFSRMVDIRGADGRIISLTSSAAERAALAERFGLIALQSLEAEVTLSADGSAIAAEGRLKAEIVQPCAVSGEDLPVTIDEPLAFRFVPARDVARADEEVELEAEELDEIPFTGQHFDLGEAVAQSLALAIDPFATGPAADEARRKLGLLDPEDVGPFAALKALKKD
jgi:uncharacterized metal-binding protein YceD (DUF177 family)